jgi:hypothetical protein
MPFCRSCNAEIVWIKTKAGKLMPLDPPVLTVVTDQGETVRGRESHWATCPGAGEHRRAQQVQPGIVRDERAET